MAEKRKCHGTTPEGKPCRANPMRDSDYCLAHASSNGEVAPGLFGGPQGGGRPRNPRPSEVARRLIEENVLALQRPYWRTLGYDVEIGPDGPRLVDMDGGGAKVYGTSKDGETIVSGYDDLGAHINAAERLQDRVYGKPRQTTEISGPDSGPVEVIDVADPEVRKAFHELLRKRPARREE